VQVIFELIKHNKGGKIFMLALHIVSTMVSSKAHRHVFLSCSFQSHWWRRRTKYL